MSYNIAVVNFRLPETFKDACNLVNPAVEVDVVGVAKIYQDFHDQVTRIFPCLCSLSDDEVDDSVWSDGPLINNFMVKAPVIGFVYSRVNEVLPVVIELALKMGLSVLDWQSKKVYNP